ncbi:MAG: hypothetical protein ACYCOU_02925 [Sulfobacillus sp.]
MPNVIIRRLTYNPRYTKAVEQLSLDAVYASLGASDDLDYFFACFRRIYSYERDTYALLMDLLYRREDWLEHAEFVPALPPPTDLLMRVRKNHVLGRLFDQLNHDPATMSLSDVRDLLRPARQYLKEASATYVDIYNKDYEIDEYLRSPEFGIPYARVCAMTYRGRYVGHVYNYDRNEIIGIRTSLDNTLARFLRLDALRGVAPIFLDAIRQYLRELGYSTMRINSPVGIMPGIARSYGFTEDDDEGFYVMSTEAKARIDVPRYELSF